MTSAQPQATPQHYARIGGMAYLVIIVAGIYAEGYVRSSLIQTGDPATTLNAIASAETLFRTGMAADLLVLVCDLIVTVVLYELLKPTNQPLALLATLFRVVMTAISGTKVLYSYEALLLAMRSESISGLDLTQAQTLAMLDLNLHTAGYAVSLVFFGFHCLLIGYLIMRSGYMPAVIGGLLITAGICYLINSCAILFVPDLAEYLSPLILVPALVAELALTCWLLVRGIRLPGWQAQQERLQR